VGCGGGVAADAEISGLVRRGCIGGVVGWHKKNNSSGSSTLTRPSPDGERTIAPSAVKRPHYRTRFYILIAQTNDYVDI